MLECDDCNKKYIGEPEMILQKRISRHIRRLDDNTQCRTALSVHAVTENHEFKFQDVKILDSNKDMLKRNNLYIVENKGTVHYKKKDIKHVGKVFHGLYN